MFPLLDTPLFGNKFAKIKDVHTYSVVHDHRAKVERPVNESQPLTMFTLYQRSMLRIRASQTIQSNQIPGLNVSAETISIETSSIDHTPKVILPQ